MANYDIAALNSGGLTVTSFNGECRHDVDLRHTARLMIPTGGIAEIWEGTRRVGDIAVPFSPQTPSHF
jgi:hypothetical protein